MNPLTRQVLVDLIEDAADEQILSAITQPSVSVLLHRYLLKEYINNLSSTPGLKMDHQSMILHWSQILGYIEMEEQRLRATASYGTLPSYAIQSAVNPNISKPCKHSPISDSTKKSMVNSTNIHTNTHSITKEIIEEDFAPEKRNNPWRMKKRLSQKMTVIAKNTKRKRAATYSAGCDSPYKQTLTTGGLPFQHPYTDAVNSFTSTQNLFRPPSHVIEEDVEESDYSDGDNPTLVSQYRIVSCSPRITPPQGTTPRVGNAKIFSNAAFILNEEYVDIEMDDDALSIDISIGTDDESVDQILIESPMIEVKTDETFKDFSIINSDSSGDESLTPHQYSPTIKQIKISANDTYKHTHLLPLPMMINTFSNYSNISAHTSDIDLRLLPKQQYLQMNPYSTFSNIISHPRMTEYASLLLGTVNNQLYDTQNIVFDLSDEECEIVVEMPLNVGNFHASLFMRVWLNIAAYLTQNEKLLSLQFVSKKFRAIALATNHWQSISIPLPMDWTLDLNQNMIRFLFSIATTVHSIDILNCSSLLMMDNERCSSVLKNVLGNASDLVCIQIASSNCMNEYSYYYFPSLMRVLLSLTNVSEIRELRIHGCVNVEDMNEFLLKSVTIRNVCFDICEEDEKQLLCHSLPMEMEEFWMPRCTTEEWLFEWMANRHLSNLRCLQSFPKILNYTSMVEEKEMMIKPGIVYDRYCFSAACLHLIADECKGIQYISIDCKLNMEYAQALKYLLSKCNGLQCIQLRFSIAFYIFEEMEFWMKFAELKIECLKILEEFSFKYHCCSSVYFKNEYEMNESKGNENHMAKNYNCTQHASEYDLTFILYKK